MEIEYDENSNAVARTDFTGKRRSEYALNVDGQIAKRTEFDLNKHKGDLRNLSATTLAEFRLNSADESKSQTYIYFDGNLVGEAGDFDVAPVDYAAQNAKATAESNKKGSYSSGIKANFQPVSQRVDTGQGTTTYFAKDGDTLKTVALQLYGDESLWHVIAAANGLRGSEKLVEGTLLSVPEAVYAVANNAFVYHLQANDIGDVSAPTLTEFAITKSDQVEQFTSQVEGIGIEIIAIVVGSYGGPLAYAATKQVLNEATGRQNGFHLKNFVIDVATGYAAKNIGPGKGAKPLEVIARSAAVATVNAGIRGAVYEYDKRQGKDRNKRDGAAFSLKGLSLDIATTAVTTALLPGVKDPAKIAKQSASRIVADSFTRAAFSNVTRDVLARAIYDDYDDYKDKQGGSFLYRTLQGGLINTTNGVLNRGKAREELAKQEASRNESSALTINQKVSDQRKQVIQSNDELTSEELILMQQENDRFLNELRNGNRQEDQMTSQAAFKQPEPEELTVEQLFRMQASANGFVPGAMVDTGAASFLGGITGDQFNDEMRAELGQDVAGQGDGAVATDDEYGRFNFDSLFDDGPNPFGIIGDTAPDYGSELLDDTINATQNVLGNISSATNNIIEAGSDILDSISRPFSIIGDEAPDYGSELLDDTINATQNVLGNISSGIADAYDGSLLQFGVNAFERDLIDPFRESAFDGTLNLLNRAFYLPAAGLDALGVTGENSRGSYSTTVSVAGSTGVDAEAGPASVGVNGTIGAEFGIAFDGKGNLFYTRPEKVGGFVEVSAETGLQGKLQKPEGMKFRDLLENANVSIAATINRSETARPDQLLGGVSVERNRSLNLNSGRVHGLTATRVNGLTTNLTPTEVEDRQYFTSDIGDAVSGLLSGEAWKNQNAVHQYSGIGLGYTLNLADRTPSVSYEDGRNVTIQYKLGKASTSNYSNILKTGYGLLRGFEGAYQLQQEIGKGLTSYSADFSASTILLWNDLFNWSDR